MKSIPDHVKSYMKTALFTHDTVPAGLLKNHMTKEGTWALIRIQEGRLEYTIEESEICILEPGHDGVIEPQVSHNIRPLGQVSFFIEFYK